MMYSRDIHEIISVAASVTGVSQQDLKGPSRKRSIAYPRFVAMKAVREATGKSYPAIAEAFNRDHSTIITGVRKAAEVIADHADAAEDYHNIMVLASRSKAHLQCFAYENIDRSALV